MTFALNRLGAAINLNDKMRISGWEGIGSEVVTSSLQGEAIGNLESGGEMSRVEYLLNCVSGLPKFWEGRSQHSAGLRMWNETESGLSDDAQHALRAHKQAYEVEAGFVLMTS